MNTRNRARVIVACFALAAVAAIGCFDSTNPRTDPIANPTGLLNVGDLLKLNVNTNDPCESAVYHAARVVAVGTKSIIFEDTLNPKNGFTTADYQKFAARFDTLIYPLDAEAFGEPTDIDKNGRIAIVFTRAVNELTPRSSATYTGGFAFSRDAFPNDGNSAAAACAGSNQGEYFYALAPDPTGSINGNVRSKAFVDSVTTPVLAHELQHIINFTRRLYVNGQKKFEETWLDEGLAHIAEELLFYREGFTVPRLNLDITAVRATTAIRNAYNQDQTGNSSRYRSYLLTTPLSSPYALYDSVTTRGAAWNFFRYAADRLAATDGFAAGNGQVVSGSGTVVVPAGTGSEYSITIVNTSTQRGTTASYLYTTATGAGVVSERVLPLARTVSSSRESESSNEGFESRLRARERAELTPRMAAAEQWFAGRADLRVNAVSGAIRTDVDGGIWFRLVNNSSVGMTNLQSVLNNDVSGFIRDWAVSQAVDDVASPGTQYQQRSWNYHNLFANLGTGGGTYGLPVTTTSPNATASSTLQAGASSYFRLLGTTLPVTINLNPLSGTAQPTLQMIVVKIR